MSIKKGLEDIIRGYADNLYFQSRKHFNEEDVILLENNDSFKSSVKRIKKLLKIPRLDPLQDIVIIPITYGEDGENEGEILKSDWLNSQPLSIQNSFESEVKQLLETYKLQANFYEWFVVYLLYGKPLYTPYYHWELTDFVINNLNRIEEIPLTIKEKRYVLDSFKAFLGKNPDIPKEQKKAAYKELKGILKRSKSKRRRFRTLRTAIKALRLGEVVSEYDYATAKEQKRKIISEDLATQIFDDDTGKKAALVRKQKQRLLQKLKN